MAETRKNQFFLINMGRASQDEEGARSFPLDQDDLKGLIEALSYCSRQGFLNTKWYIKMIEGITKVKD